MISRTARRPSLPGFIVQRGAEGDLRSPERENLTSALARGVFGLRILVVNFSSFFCFCFCFGLIGTCLLSARQVHAEQSPGCVPQTLHGQWGAALWQAVAKANIIYVGETHDRPGDHAYELRLVREMIRRRIAFAIGWEM
ncbi:MAG TPA: ChaN family lipoprotein, partial [Chthoniobacterales bacterium]|nr:ChaN family lipoprotein [Chthoniobacterales bacterium]